MKQIRKTYTDLNPELLLAEIREFVVAMGMTITSSKQETYMLPDDSANFGTRGTLVFGDAEGKIPECLRVHIVGSLMEETKLLIDVDETCFEAAKLTSLLEDVDFIFGSREAGKS
jgi:hypothetical protein